MHGKLRVVMTLAVLLAGCQATAPQPGGGGTASATPRASAPIVPSNQPDRTRRAREVYLRGVALVAQDARLDEAIRDFQHALEIDPLFHLAHFKLGICYYQKGEYSLEITEYKKCLSINPQYEPAWLNLGHAHLARDELQQARDAYRRVLELSPGHGIALYNLALIEFDLKNEGESERLFRAFLRHEANAAGDMGERAREYLRDLDRRAAERRGQAGS